LLTSKPRHGTVAAGTDLKVVKITGEVLAKLEEKAPKIASALYKTLATTLADQLLAITSRDTTPTE
jgi:CRP-like cAMP-binding protein